MRGPPVGAGGRDDLADVLGLVRRGRERELARLLEAGVDPVAGDRLLDRCEVLAPETLELRHLLGPARHPVLDPVGQRRVREAAVPPAGAEGDALALQQHDLAPRALLAREQRGPESRQPAADHEQVRLDVALQRRPGSGAPGRQPERPRLGLGEGAQDLGREREVLIQER